VAALYVGTGVEEPDFLAVVDVDPNSATYGKIVHKLPMPDIGDELHHFGWNACSSAYCPNARPFLERRYPSCQGLSPPGYISWIRSRTRGSPLYIK
jgi:selenium-binding protein 1